MQLILTGSSDGTAAASKPGPPPGILSELDAEKHSTIIVSADIKFY